MMINMKQFYNKEKTRRGAALLIVLFIVMAITILSLGFLSRCDTELACGQNTLLYEQMNSLAYSGLEHAKGLTLYPQDVTGNQYWNGENGQQLVSGSDYYDVKIAMHDSVNDPDTTYRCTYDVKSEAYRLKGGQKIGRSSVEGELRLDPCIAYWSNASITIPSRMNIYGDTYCGGNLLNLGTLNGDVFVAALNGTAAGQISPIGALTTVTWPNVTVANFTSENFSVQSVSSPLSSVQYPASAPPKVYNCAGSMNIQSGVTINGMLLVQGDLRVSGTNNNIIAGKNVPALYVTGDLIIADDGQLNVFGLAVVEQRVRVAASADDVHVYGGLFTKNGLFETAFDLTVNANNALLNNGPVWQSAGGQTGGAIEFDGVDDYLQTTDSTNLSVVNDYTFSVWVKTSSNQKAAAGIFSQCSADGSTNHWAIQFDSSASKLMVYHPGGSWETGITMDEIKDGAWHNIRVVRIGSTMRSYLDALQKKDETWLSPPGSGNGHLNIAVDRMVSVASTFQGSIDELKIYNAAPAEGVDFPLDSELLAYWNFDKTRNGKVNVYASPDKAAIIVWDNTPKQVRWQQAGGAFYRSIKRNQ